jgi:hypothetical protein
LVVGSTDSGKSTTARAIAGYAAVRYPVLVIDTKPERRYTRFGYLSHDWDESLAVLDDGVEHWKRTGRHQPVVVYRPADDVPLLLLPDHVDGCLVDVFEAKYPTLYVFIDEGAMVSDSGRPGEGVRRCWQQGREREDEETGDLNRMSMVVCIQRPAWVPKDWREQSKIKIVHYLGEEDHVEMLKAMHADRKLPPAADMPGASEHAFWFHRRGAMKQPRLVDLKVKESGKARRAA